VHGNLRKDIFKKKIEIFLYIYIFLDYFNAIMLKIIFKK
jgi:hypothetical protein